MSDCESGLDQVSCGTENLSVAWELSRLEAKHTRVCPGHIKTVQAPYISLHLKGVATDSAR